MTKPKDNNTISKAQSIFRALNHSLRMKIIDFIRKKESTNVTSIYEALDLEQSVTSQHLRTLRDAGVLECKREGKEIFYVVNQKRLQKINDLAEELVNN